MDDHEDATRQVKNYQVEGESSLVTSDYFRNPSSAFCENPSCLGDKWHEWGCCQRVSSYVGELQESTLVHIDGDGCGYESERAGAPSHASTSSERRFALLKTEAELAKARAQSIPQKTREDTAYCIRVWKDWSEFRSAATETIVPPLEHLSTSTQELQHWLIRFISEIRKKNGSEYPATTLHHIVSGVMRHIRYNLGKPEIDFYKDPEFSKFRISLDAEMKRLQSAGVGTMKRQAEPLTLEEEELLWEKRVLGDHSPKALLNSMMFMNGLYFALRSGAEHRQLRYKPCQIELVEKPEERAYLVYREDISKNHPGGLKGLKHKPKIVVHHANIENPDRCFVRLFKLYRDLCPKDRPDDAFYLAPLKKYTKSCWFSKSPVGHNTLKNFMSNMCKEADIQGFKTNHSLRATAATRLYESGIDEQLVMERTGHRSIEGIRSYKRTSAAQQQDVSDILSNSKRSHYSTDRDIVPFKTSGATVSQQLTQLSSTVNNLCMSNYTEPSSDNHAGSFNFSSCSGITLNFNCNIK